LERRTQLVELSASQLHAAMSRVLGNTEVRSYEPLASGRANTLYAVTTRHGKLVLRLHVRSPDSCAKERALHALVTSSVAVPPLLGVCQELEVLGHPFSVSAFVEGQTLEQALLGGNALRLETAARSLGHTLARLTQFRYETFGDLIAEPTGRGLRVSPWTFADFYRLVLFESPAAARLGELRDRVWQLVQTSAERFPDGWPPHLVHGDFNPSNLLIGDSGEVVAVLDWEFAHAGKLWMDLGNLLRDRPELPLPPYFVPALAEGLDDLGVKLPPTWRKLCLLEDLASACEFLSSAEDKPIIHARALNQIQRSLTVLEQ
jgi:aminoglycoside phosphotransferase (APT) family kinase protein